MDEVVANLRACLLSSKGGISLNRIDKDYYDIVGERIPYRKFNFKTLEEFLSIVPGLKKILRGREYFIEAIPSEKTAHVADLVQKQRTDKKTRRIQANAYNRPNRVPINSNSNYQRNNAGFRPANNRPTARFQINPRSLPNLSSNSGSRFPPSGKVPTKSVSMGTANLPQRQLITYTNEAPKPAPIIQPVVTEKIPPTTASLKPLITSSKPTTDFKVHEPEKPRSTLQSRLVVNTDKPKIEIKAYETKENFEKEDPTKYYNVTFNSMVPFEEINKKRPQEELRIIAETYNLPPPIYKISGAVHGNIYASVTVGNENFASYPEPAKSEHEARTIAARIALEGIKRKRETVSLPVTESEKLIKDRILKIVDSHPTGVFTTQISKYYEEEFKELLPEEWLKIIKEYSEINVEQGVDNTSILTRYVPVQLEEKDDNIPLSPFSKMKLNPFDRQSTPPALQIPEDPYWVTHVTVVYSADEVCVQIVGKDYSDKFAEMTEQMNEFYKNNSQSTKASQVDVNEYYTIYVDQNWYRVKCLDIDPKTDETMVYFIDYGDDEPCHASMLHELVKQFCELPAQALRVSLFELEEFCDCKGAKPILEESLLEQTLYIEVKSADSEDLSVVFYNTKGTYDVNLNKLMAAKIIETCIPRPQVKGEGSVHEMFVSHISQSGEVSIQFKDVCLSYLVNLMNKLIELKLSQDVSEFKVDKVNLIKVYVVKCPESGDWYRVKVLNVNYLTQEVDVFCLDFGKTFATKIGELVELEKVSEVLAIFPPQAIPVQLANIPPSSFDAEKVEKLKKLIPLDQPLILKVIQNPDIYVSSPPVVELFKRQQPSNEIVSINNTLILESELKKSILGDSNNNVKDRKRSERLISRYGSSVEQDNQFHRKSLKQPKIPSVNEYFDVHVTLVSNPGNFLIQPFEDQKRLQAMNQKLQLECNNYKGEPLLFENVKEGTLYVAKSNGQWYRACVLNKFTVQMMVTVYFCDYGEVTLVQMENLQPLSGHFFELPYQAIRAKLADVKGDWSVEDCLRFKELIEKKDMVSMVKNVSTDGGETVLTLSLIDVSKEQNILIDEVLIKEGRAQRTESYLNSNAAK